MRTFPIAIGIVVLVLFARQSTETQAQPAKLLNVIELDYHRGPGAPMPLPGFGNNTAYLVDSVSVKGKRWHALVATFSPQHGSIRFDRLLHGEVIPLFGQLFRVDGNKLLRLKSAEIPKGITIGEESFVVPVMRNETGSGQITYLVKPGETRWHTVFVSEIHSADAKNAEPIALIKIDDINNKARTIKSKDIVILGESEWVVQSIVPTDKERHLYGWVEFSPLKKEKGKE